MTDTSKEAVERLARDHRDLSDNRQQRLQRTATFFQTTALTLLALLDERAALSTPPAASAGHGGERVGGDGWRVKPLEWRRRDYGAQDQWCASSSFGVWSIRKYRESEWAIYCGDTFHGYRSGEAEAKAGVVEVLTMLIEQDIEPAPATGEDAALERFAAWFRKNYPGPDTIIHKPDWHAPKIFRAVLAALSTGSPA